MLGWILAGTLGALLLLAALPASAAAEPVPAAPPPYTPHAPILIDGDAGFLGANGVVGGRGTAADPYLIAGWEINASYAGIEIRNTNASFVIQDVRVYNGTCGVVTAPCPVYGILVGPSSNGRIDRANVSNVQVGVALAGVSRFRVENSTVAENWYGINIGALCASPTDCLDSEHVTVAGNRVLNNTNAGLSLSADNSTIVGNLVEGNGEGISVSGHGPTSLNPASLTVADNLVLSNVGHGITVLAVRGITVSNNTVSDSESYGLQLLLSLDLDVRGNRFTADSILLAGIDEYRLDSISISEDNTVNGKPVLFIKNETTGSPLEINGSAYGEVIVERCWNVDIHHVQISNADIGIEVGLGAEVVIHDSDFSSVTEAVYLQPSDNVTIYHNNFLASGVRNESTATTYWDAGYPTGGNYWLGYNFPDRCSGPDQDVCPDPDGIGDIPIAVVISQEIQAFDHYPLEKPLDLNDARPVARLSVSPASGDVSTTFAFDASSSTDSEGPPGGLAIRWDWDGDWRFDTNWKNETSARHLYTNAGFYTVRVEVRDSAGMLSVAEVMIQVRPFSLAPIVLTGLVLSTVVVIAVAALWMRFRQRRGADRPRRPADTTGPPEERAR